ncbi:PIR Superfamily Protein [Plasmodium ovale wallikeri]|uniref:PIR Superfamily Protein n=1 Tax=Plasmodium ovale wallikeri TaxID=864142 RepID=A0A1A9ANQ9_PLAOA|nr:PIR Superfamily Protein [Plasmodium ovale wallikeri]
MCNKKLPNLPSNQMYNTYDENKADVTCVTCCNNLQSLNEAFPGIHDMCKRLAKNINYIKEKKTSDNLNYLCTYLFYWIHENVTKLNIDAKSNYKNIMDMLHSECNDIKKIIGIPDNNLCNYEVSKLDIENVNKKKYFFEFFDDYETMRKEIAPSGGNCSKYFDYITDIAKMYGELDKICKPDINNCYKFYTINKNPNPNILLSSPSCSNIADSKRPFSDSFPHSSPQAADHQGNASNFEYYHTYIAVVLSLLGIILMFFFIYKLTPIGPWLYNQLLKKKLLRNYFNGEDSQELLEYTSDSVDMNSQKTEYNLQYYSA